MTLRDQSLESASERNESGGDSFSGYRDPLSPGGDPGLIAQLPPIDPRALEDLRASIEAADYTRTDEVVREGWFDLLTGDHEALRLVVAQLPPKIIRDSPLLAMLSGLAHFGTPHRRVKALRHLIVAIRAASSTKSELTGLDQALILTATSVGYRLLGRPNQGVAAARSALQVLHELDEVQRDVSMLPRLYGQLGTTLYYGGHIHEALNAFEHGLAEVPAEGFPHGFMNLSMLAGIHAFRGDLSEARSYIEYARDGSWPHVVRVAYPGTFYQLAEAIVALERFDPESARSHLDLMVHDRHTIEHWIPIAITEAVTLLIAGRPGAGLAGLDAFAALRQSEGRSAESRRRLAPTRALLQLALGNPDAAGAILHRDAQQEPGRSIGLARVELALGRHGAALQHVRAVAGATMSPRHLVEHATIEAAALLRFSDRARSRSVVDHLGSVLLSTHQRVAVTFVPEADYQRILSALAAAGHDRIVADLPARSCIPDPDSAVLLSPREMAVLEELARTASVPGIAVVLVVSVNTVKTQLRSVYRKLGVTNRDEAIAVALDRHLVGGASSEGHAF